MSDYSILVFNCMSISWNKELVDSVISDLQEDYKYVNLYQLFQPTYTSGIIHLFLLQLY